MFYLMCSWQCCLHSRGSYTLLLLVFAVQKPFSFTQPHLSILGSVSCVINVFLWMSYPCLYVEVFFSSSFRILGLILKPMVHFCVCEREGWEIQIEFLSFMYDCPSFLAPFAEKSCLHPSVWLCQLCWRFVNYLSVDLFVSDSYVLQAYVMANLGYQVDTRRKRNPPLKNCFHQDWPVGISLGRFLGR